MTASSETSRSTFLPVQTIEKRFLSNENLRLLASGLFLSTAFLILFSLVQSGSAALVGTDGYYHARMGWLIREAGLKPPFIWLPMTILNEGSFYDHHLLYHLYLSLFSGVDPVLDGGQSLTFGVKLASIILPSLTFIAVWWLLRSLNVRWAAIWSLGLFAVSEAFLYRLSMPRAQAASLLVLVVGLYCLFQRRYWLLVPLGFVYVWLYDAFPLLLVLGAIYLVATWMTERRIEWKAVIFPGIGITLGLLINPYFPENIAFITSHLLPKIGEIETRVGNEWYPYETWTLVENSGFALAAMTSGALAWGWRKERMDRVALTIFLVTILFAVMLFRSRRFVEYFPAFALIFAAISFTPLIENWTANRKKWNKLAPGILLVVLALPIALTVSQARDAVGRSKPADLYAEAATWLHENTPPGSLIFQTDWDDFTRLFFYSPNNLYTVGLDPTYMELFDADLFEEWRQITRGKVERPSRIIRNRFGASYVFSDFKHKDFMSVAAEDPLLVELYRDKYAVIYSVDQP
ncbi:MAG: hypothetical protein PVH03_14275 [Chloroflexota bacterium]|jgi:hypothetical protein